MISILYVDDDVDQLDLGKAFLEEMGDFQVRKAASAKEGMMLLRDLDFDVIISDYQMPEMDGIGFLKTVKAIHHDMPFILFTGKGREEVVIEAINNGVDFYVQKGGDPEAQFIELAHKVRQAVNRHRAELDLQKKTVELDNFFMLSLDMLCIADMDGRFVRANRAWEDLLGNSLKELEGKRFLDFVHPDDVIPTQMAMSELESGNIAQEFINRYRTKNGDYRWIEWRSIPYEGRLVYTAARDITERKLAEDNLREACELIAANEEQLRQQFDELIQNQDSLRAVNLQLNNQEEALRTQLEQITSIHKELVNSEKIFRLLVENVPEAIFIARDDFRFVFINRAGVSMFGASDADQLLGTPVLDRIHPSFHSRVRERVRHLTVECEPVKPLEEVYIRMDGTPIVVEVNAVPFNYRGENESLVIVRDITERKRAEEALQRSEQMLKIVLDNFPGVVYWKDRNLVYLGANRESAKIVGFNDSKEYVGKTDYDMPWANTEAEAYRADDLQVMESGKPKLHKIERQLRAGGEIGWLDTSKVPLHDSEGNVVGVLGTSTDITELKKAEEKLLEANLVLENGPAVLFRWRIEEGWPVELVSKNIRQSGYSQEEFLSGAMKFAHIIHPEDLDRVREEVENHTALGEDHFEQTYRILSKEGDVHWVDDRTATVKDEAGRVSHLQGIIIDITDRISSENALMHKNEELNKAYDTLSRIEERLRGNYSRLSAKEHELEASEKRYRMLLEQTFDAIITHCDGRIVLANEAACRLFGARSIADLIGRSIIEFGGPESKEVIVQRMKHLYANPGTIAPLVDMPFRRLDGSIIDVEVIAASYLEQGKTHVQAVLRDVSERNRILNDLRESEKKYHELFELGGEAIFLIDNEDGRLMECNTAATEIYGYGHDELVQMHNTDLSAEPAATRKVTAESPTGEVVVPLRYHRRKDGSTFPVEINGRFFSWKGRRAHVAAIRDITERKRIDDALRQINRKLNLLNSITRHDIVNKITVLQANLAIAKTKSIDPLMTEYLERLDKTTKAIQEHVEFSRIYQDLGLQEPAWQPLEEVIGALDVPLELKIERMIDGIEVYADPMLRKVFYNLLDNTIRHGKKSTEVVISLNETNDGLIIVWEDNGIGVANTEKEMIFEHGYGKNTGLGLFISREILAITNIGIMETGKEGAGARFEISIPNGGYRRVDLG